MAECIIIENKSVQAMPSIHEAQLLTYLKLSGHRLGFLVNWNGERWVQTPLISPGSPDTQLMEGIRKPFLEDLDQPV